SSSRLALPLYKGSETPSTRCRRTSASAASRNEAASDGAGRPIRYSRAYTRSYQIMRHRLPGLILALLSVSACSVVSIDLTPRVRPLEESTVEGTGTGKVLLIDLGGVLAEEPLITLESRPQVPLLARVREELEKAEGDDKVKALVLRINSPGGTVTASD